jgi:hypothetical protein
MIVIFNCLFYNLLPQLVWIGNLWICFDTFFFYSPFKCFGFYVSGVSSYLKDQEKGLFPVAPMLLQTELGDKSKI